MQPNPSVPSRREGSEAPAKQALAEQPVAPEGNTGAKAPAEQPPVGGLAITALPLARNRRGVRSKPLAQSGLNFHFLIVSVYVCGLILLFIPQSFILILIFIFIEMNFDATSLVIFFLYLFISYLFISIYLYHIISYHSLENSRGFIKIQHEFLKILSIEAI